MKSIFSTSTITEKKVILSAAGLLLGGGAISRCWLHSWHNVPIDERQREGDYDVNNIYLVDLFRLDGFVLSGDLCYLHVDCEFWGADKRERYHVTTYWYSYVVHIWLLSNECLQTHFHTTHSTHGEMVFEHVQCSPLKWNSKPHSEPEMIRFFDYTKPRSLVTRVLLLRTDVHFHTFIFFLSLPLACTFVTFARRQPIWRSTTVILTI